MWNWKGASLYHHLEKELKKGPYKFRTRKKRSGLSNSKADGANSQVSKLEPYPPLEKG